MLSRMGTKPMGFFELRSPLDLLEKLRHDYDRLCGRPHDQYAAFDYFVTAAHLPEWLSKAQCSPGSSDRRTWAIRNICGHLANGAKHFAVNDARHNSIAQADVSRPTYGEATYGQVTYGEQLWIELEEEEAEVLGRSAWTVIELAGLVLSHWKAHESVRRAARREKDAADACG